MVGEDDEWAIAQEVIEFRNRPFYCIFLLFCRGPLLFRGVESVRGDCYDLFPSIFRLLHQNGTTSYIAGIGSEGEELRKVWKRDDWW